MLKTAIIGAGNMGSALYEGMLQDGRSADVVLCDRNEEKLHIAPSQSRFTDIPEATGDAECVVIAVKPQAFSDLMKSVEQAWASKLIVSIMAGMPIPRLETLTGSPRVIRSMPNLGAKIRRSVTGWCASEQATMEDRTHAASVFQGIGLSIELDAEDKIDAFTAVAGSGPAYVFGLGELLQQSAKQLGLPDDQAALVASEVIAASSQLFREGKRSAKEWREAVTSKGGVTEAAMHIFAKRKLADIFKEALQAGALRSKILSSET